LETEIKSLAFEAKMSRRQEVAVPLLNQFKVWLDKQSVPPKTLLGKAIGYALNEWSRLIIYTQDGRLNIDNNLIENTIRPFAIGRKNWLFSQSTQGAAASANLYGLIETAKANGINEYAYLKLLFTELPLANTQEQLQNLLPWNINPHQLNEQLIKPS
jgi:transposase